VKEFWIYTGLRIALFLGAFGIVFGIWAAVTGDVPVIWAVAIAFIVSGVGSYYLLERQREAFARRVDARAHRASRKLEEMRSKEDTD
jgi:uncharacterized membrane protein